MALLPFRACLEEKLLLAKYFHREIQKLGFVSDLQPELSVVTYRYVPKSGNADEFNKKLLEAVVADGRRIYLVDGSKWPLYVAVCVSGVQDHLSTVDTLLQVLGDSVASLKNTRS